MISLVSLLVAAALVSQQCGFEANAQIDDSKLTMDNSLQPNVVAPRAAKRPRRLNKYVNIGSPPAKEVRRLSGERVVLECVAMGNPPPSIYWMKNGQTIQDPSEDMNEILPMLLGMGQLRSKLVITAAAPGEDEYVCVAEAGQKRQTATSTVFTIPTDDDEEDLLALEKLFFPTKPIITYNYESLLQELGSAALLPCRVHSHSPAQVSWQDNHERTVYGNPRMRVLPSGDLLISSLLWSDMGNFTCIAKNMSGKDSASMFVYPIKP